MMKTILLFAVVVSTMALDLPSNFKTCKKSDPKALKCIADAAKDAVVSMARGLKSFKILPFEPLMIDSIKFDETQSSMSLKQEFRNVKLYGLTKDLRLYNYQIDWDKLIFRSDSSNSQVDFIADYKLEGKILILPIRGEGRCNISMHNLMIKHEIYFEKFQKDGDTYMKAIKYIIKLIPEHITFYFDNLFNGDAILGEQMNRFFNENFDLIFKEFKALYEEVFSLIFIKLTNDIFTRVPMNKIFL